MPDEFEYDNNGRLKYHPKLHPNHMKPWNLIDLEYICKFHETDEIATLALAVGRTQSTVATKLSELEKSGQMEFYKNINMYW